MTITSILVRMILTSFVFDPICGIFCATACSSVPVTLVEMVPAAPVSQLELPLPSTELNGHCQESCIVECCKLPLFDTGDKSLNTAACTHPPALHYCCCSQIFVGIFYAFIRDFNSRKLTGNATRDPRQTLTRDIVVHGHAFNPKPQVHPKMFLSYTWTDVHY